MKIILTESQMRGIIQEEIAVQNLLSLLSNISNPNQIFKTLYSALVNKQTRMPTVMTVLNQLLNGTPQQQAVKQDIMQKLEDSLQPEQTNDAVQSQAETWQNNLGTWKTVANDAIATVYNAVPKQCNNDVAHTASMFKLNLSNVLSQKVIAMERTFMRELGVKYGDVVWVSGTGKWDGAWQIQDTMNKKFAGMHKIDLLVPSNVRTGKWDGVTISVPVDEKTKLRAKGTMKGSI